MAISAPDLARQTQLAPQLQALAESLNEQDLCWASGYLAGLAAASSDSRAVSAAAAAEPKSVLTIWYGSQTGNARRVAEKLASEASAQGLATELASLGEIKPRSIEQVQWLALVVSTHGDGDPPEDAEALLEWLRRRNDRTLASLSYSVFALGDSSYPHFCQTGHDFHEALSQRGASSLLDVATADVDVEQTAQPWRLQALQTFTPLLGRDVAAEQRSGPNLQVVEAQSAADRDTPVEIEVLEVSALTVDPAQQSVHHIALDVAGSGLRYQAGDALGVWPRNAAESVSAVLSATGLDGDQVVSYQGRSQSLRDWLTNERELTQVSRALLADYQTRSAADGLQALLDAPEKLQKWASERQVADLLSEYPQPFNAEDLVALLRPISPRLYSIASGPAAEPDEIHLTVATVGGETERGLRAGAASWWLNRTLQSGDSARAWVESNPRFRLPEDDNTAIIMVGAGTGIAPFRGFLQQREAEGAQGANWLIFGNRWRRADFLYQLEWQRWLKQGLLTTLTPVFSRDQPEAPQRYVQHAVLEHGELIYRQLRDGAHFYVCGAIAMAEGVHQALNELAQTHGGLSADEANEWLRELRSEKRYQKDVY